MILEGGGEHEHKWCLVSGTHSCPIFGGQFLSSSDNVFMWAVVSVRTPVRVKTYCYHLTMATYMFREVVHVMTIKLFWDCLLFGIPDFSEHLELHAITNKKLSVVMDYCQI